MRDDIVARLRASSMCLCFKGNKCAKCEAADEIQRLRTIIRDYYFTEKEYESCRDESDIVYLKDEWKAAWKALEEEAVRRDKR